MSEEKIAPKFSQEQYEMLKRCSVAEKITEWNEWRKENPDEDIHLQGAVLEGFFLKDVWFFTGGSVEDLGSGGIAMNGEVRLEGAKFRKANLENARFDRAHLEGADFYMSKIKGADFGLSHLQKTCFKLAIVDSSTLFWEKDSITEKLSKPACRIDKKTNFEGVPLDNIRIDPYTKQLLQYNIRKSNWGDWYKSDDEPIPNCTLLNIVLKKLIQLFWWISNYGKSTLQIIITFFALAFIFAMAYKLCPEFVLFYGTPGEFQSFPHTFYFSIVTMTTLGFGDIAANPDSWQGQVLLMAQVILGYVLLGALVTRFAVLFTAGGPTVNFTPMDKETKQLLARIKKETEKAR